MVALVLLAFGLSGFLGNFASGLLAERNARLAVALASLALATTAALLLTFGMSPGVDFAAAALWGLAFGAFPIGVQTWTAQSAPEYAESAGALLRTTFQIAIALGAVAGGLLVDRTGASGAIGYCSITALVGGILMLALGHSRTSKGSA